MEVYRGIHNGSVGANGPGVGPKWNKLANTMRDTNRIRQAGTLIGYMTFQVVETNSPTVISRAGNAFARAIEPPLSSEDHAAFEGGVNEVIETLTSIGGVS